MFDITIKKGLVINILIHMCVLFVFLYLFFFFVVSKREQETIKKESLITSKCTIPKLLKIIDERDQYVDWNKVKEKAQDILSKNNDSIDNVITDNNRYLVWVGIVIPVTLLLLIIVLYFYYTRVLNEKIDIYHIIQENAAVFLFVGVIEFVFFTMTASKYAPIYGKQITNTVFERVKTNIMKME